MSSSTNRTYDTIVIGASPLAILEALYRHAQGHRVALITDADVIGGAWRTIQHPGLPPLEIGCHIWDNNDEVMRFLVDYLDLDLAPFVPSPTIQYGRLSLPYDWKYFILDLKARLGRIKPITNHKLIQYGLVPQKFYYPRRGSTELIERLDERLGATDIDVVLNTVVNTIDVADDVSITLEAGDGTSYSCHGIAVTGQSRLDRFVCDGEDIELETPRLVDYVHAHLVVRDDTPVNFSYIRVHDDDHIHRVSDITYQMPADTFGGKRLIMAGLFGKRYSEADQDQLRDIVMGYLVEHGLVGKQAELEEIHWNVYSTSYVERDSFEATIEPMSNVHFIQSDSIIPAIAKQLDRWKAVLLDDSGDIRTRQPTSKRLMARD